jgi:hypothetical protein
MVLTNHFENLLDLGIPYFKRTLCHKRPTARVPIGDHHLSNIHGLKLASLESSLRERVWHMYKTEGLQLVTPNLVQSISVAKDLSREYQELVRDKRNVWEQVAHTGVYK